jgi:hypothetical protein
MHTLERDLEFLLRALGAGACLVLVVVFIVYIAFLSTASRALNAVDRENRRMDPGQVWLNIIPLFNLFWMVVTVERLGESIRNEFTARGKHKASESYGKTAGLACLILTQVGVFFALIEARCGLVFWFFSLIYFLVYWVQISGYARRLTTDGPGYAPPTDEGW